MEGKARRSMRGSGVVPRVDVTCVALAGNSGMGAEHVTLPDSGVSTHGCGGRCVCERGTKWKRMAKYQELGVARVKWGVCVGGK